MLTRVICKYTQALAILKEYDYERTVLDELLAQTRWRRGRRSRWHERRACLLMTHGEQNRDAWQLALQAVEAGINDEDTHVGARSLFGIVSSIKLTGFDSLPTEARTATNKTGEEA